MNLSRRFPEPLLKPESGVGLAILIAILLVSFAYGADDLMVGINKPIAPAVNGISSAYELSDVVSSGSDVTIFASAKLGNQSNIVIAASGEDAVRMLIDGQNYQQSQARDNGLFGVESEYPVYLWDLGHLNDAGWNYSFTYNGIDYYAKGIRIDGFDGEATIKVFADNDNNYYYSLGDAISGYINPNGLNSETIPEARRYLAVTDRGEPVLTVDPDDCGNYPPGVPPNYSVVDSSYFIGQPLLPLPPPDSGGVYIYLDTTNCYWTFASHIYSQGNSLEQFHGNIVSILEEPPQLGVNVFINNFELWEDTTNNRCLQQNDRWGWSLWDSTLGIYEIWWDVTTKEYMPDAEDLNDFLIIQLEGTAIDFNIWSSGHEAPFDEYQVFLGANKVPLGTIPGYSDYGGFDVIDQYQAAVGPDPTTDPNTSVFSTHCGAGQSYNVYGVIDSSDSYYCDSQYGLHFAGPKTYQADGIQFSTYGAQCTDPCEDNVPPVCDLINDTTYFVCGDTTFNFYITAYDPDDNLVGCTMTSGPGTYENGYWSFTTSGPGVYTASFSCEDECGAACTGTVNITVDYNSPPVINAPPEMWTFVCEYGIERCLTGFDYSDPDDNIETVEVFGCELSGDTVCFITEGPTKTITLIITDECGAADTSVTLVHVAVNNPPEVTCPNDTTIFVCDYGEICLPGFDYTDPENNIDTVIVTGCELHQDTVCFVPDGPSKTITFIAIDYCGEADTCTTNINIVLNSPPEVSCPGETSLFVCDLSEVCLDGFMAGDPDDNLSNVSVSGGTLNGTTVCFTPVEGVNTIVLSAVDECGEVAACTTEVNVTLNSPPQAACPGDTTIFVCDLAEICLPGFSYSDPDDNITDISVTGGTLSGNEVCFTPVEGANTITLTVTDSCGETDQCATNVTVTLNQPPVVNCLTDDQIGVCNLVDEVCIDGFTYSDPDDNIADITVSGGTLNGSQVCFVPVEGINTITLTVTDACGETAECSTDITVTLNSPPVVNCPDDYALTVCDLSEICLDGFTYNDPDDNIADISVTGGAWARGTICFTPVVGVNTITLTVTDSCGETAECSTDITVTLNSQPVAICPGNSSMQVCDLSEICLDGFAFTDVDNNIQTIDIQGGTLVDGQVCFTPVEGVNTITATVTDSCGETDYCETQVTISLNSAPEVGCPGDVEMTVCDFSEICIDGFTYSDVDDNISDVSVNVGTLVGSEVCFTPVAGTNTITLTVTDACGAVSECSTNITVTLNSPPVASCPGNTDMLVCDLSDICITGFSFTDVDDNIETIDIAGGILDGNQVCFTPIEGINTITATVTDACGETDQCTTEINVTLNSGPVVSCPGDTVIQVEDLSEICLTGFTYSDPDNNLQSVSVDNGTLTDNTVCFIPVEGSNTITLTAVDECGLSDECVTHVTVTTNTCPEVIRPLEDTTVVCTYEDFCDTIEVTDADGDYIEMTVNYGELVPIIDEPGHWLGLYCFSVEDYDCGELNNYEIIISCDDGLCTDDILIVYDVTVLGYVDMFMDQEVFVFPGLTGTIGLYLDTHDCLCVGGITGSITWDPSVLTLLDIDPTDNLDFGAEYLHISYNAFGPGTLKFTYIADLNDQTYHGPLCDIDPTEPIFNMEFQVAPGIYPDDMLIPICFVEDGQIGTNSVSDSSGYNIWWPEGCEEPPDSTEYSTLLLNLRCGSIRIIDECNLIIGDINMNNTPFEIGDAVLLINHISDPDAYPFNDPQLWASDVNGDSIRASIADLIMILNVINGGPLAKIAPPDTPANIIIAGDNDGGASIRLQSDYAIGGVVLDLPVPDLANHEVYYNPDLGMDMKLTQDQDRIRLVLYSEDGVRIDAGATEILRIDNIDGVHLEPNEISISDAFGGLADASIIHELPLPEIFGISACYPNPFNPQTTIQFTMPTAEQVDLTVYDITGRLVKKLASGYFDAGYHEIIWKGNNGSGERVSSGVYFIKLTSENTSLKTSVEKLILLK